MPPARGLHRYDSAGCAGRAGTTAAAVRVAASATTAAPHPHVRPRRRSRPSRVARCPRRGRRRARPSPAPEGSSPCRRTRSIGGSVSSFSTATPTARSRSPSATQRSTIVTATNASVSGSAHTRWASSSRRRASFRRPRAMSTSTSRATVPAVASLVASGSLSASCSMASQLPSSQRHRVSVSLAQTPTQARAHAMSGGVLVRLHRDLLTLRGVDRPPPVGDLGQHPQPRLDVLRILRGGDQLRLDLGLDRAELAAGEECSRPGAESEIVAAERLGLSSDGLGDRERLGEPAGEQVGSSEHVTTRCGELGIVTRLVDGGGGLLDVGGDPRLHLGEQRRQLQPCPRSRQRRLRRLPRTPGELDGTSHLGAVLRGVRCGQRDLAERSRPMSVVLVGVRPEVEHSLPGAPTRHSGRRRQRHRELRRHSPRRRLPGRRHRVGDGRRPRGSLCRRAHRRSGHGAGGVRRATCRRRSLRRAGRG